MKNRTWAFLFAGLAAALLLVWKLLPGGAGDQVEIYQNGTLAQTIQLPHAGPPETIEISGPVGGNTIEISEDGVRVLSADCPDQICVAHGYLREGTGPIVCLPNRLVIRFAGDKKENGIDAVAGGRSLP